METAGPVSPVCLACPSGEFELTDPSGLPAGQVQVTLRWECPYAPSPEEPAELHEEEEEPLKSSDPAPLSPSLPQVSPGDVAQNQDGGLLLFSSSCVCRCVAMAAKNGNQ